jgi:excinuclease ABC subunit C
MDDTLSPAPLILSSLERGIQVIKEHVLTLPSSPGVYRMIGRGGDVLYVGKAKNLKKRVESYTHGSRLSVRHKRMVAETYTMAFVTTHTEIEALLLEANLIKNLNTRYNILLKDGKFFSYITLTDHPFPRLTKHRGKRNTQDTYYGPYASAETIKESLVSLWKAFKLRSCTDTYFNTRKRPCLQYHIKQCSGPCVGLIDPETYKQQAQEAHAFLNGKSGEVQHRLGEKMAQASEAMEYEKAAVYRDQIRALSALQSQQTIHTVHLEDVDVFGMEQKGDEVCIQVFMFRAGSHHGNFSIFPSHVQGMDIPEILESFLPLFYADKECPREILTSHSFANHRLVAQALSEQEGHRVSISTPKKGPRLDFIRHACQNAQEALERKLMHQQSQKEAILQLQRLLGLETPLKRIEVYDNSHIQGKDAIGAMIVVSPQGFEKKAYRKFTIKNPKVWGNDYGMMQEVIERRFAGSLKEDTTLPDLLLIDGGPGQVSVVTEALKTLQLPLPVLGIAKGPQRNAGKETFYYKDHGPFTLEHNAKLLYFLQRIRDEAHRFAIGFHRQKREKRSVESKIDSIPGVGAKRKKALLKHFGSPKGIMDAGVKDLALADGISPALALTIYTHFHKD